MEEMVVNDQSLEELNRKIDALTEQVAFLTEAAQQDQQRRQEALPPPPQQLPPDVLRLMKRLVRNTRNMEQMLDQLESFAALWQDAGPLTQDAFLTLMNRLEEAEQKGYFTFMRGGMEIADRVVSSYSEEDVRQLGDNIVLILDTVKDLTQPEVMMLMRSTAETLREDDPDEDVSMFQLLRQLNDPSVKRGLSKTLSVLGNVSET